MRPYRLVAILFVLAGWGPIFVGGGSSGTPAVTAFSFGPCIGTTNTSPSADGTCIDYDSAIKYPTHFIVDASGNKYTFGPRNNDEAYSRVFKNGVIDPDPNAAGMSMSICNTGHLCFRNGTLWYDHTNADASIAGPYITGAGIGSPVLSNYVITANGAAQSLEMDGGASASTTFTLATVPTKGTIFSGATPINLVGQTISSSDLTTNHLTFLPNAGATGREEFWILAQTSNNATAAFTATFNIRPTPATMTAGLDVAALGAAYITKAVNQGAAPTTMGIAAPTHVDYAQGSLTIKAIELPSCGTTYLSDGVTPIVYNTNYTVTQLTGMKFAPAAKREGCVFQYSVNDPLGGYAWGIVGLQITQNAIQTTYGSLSVRGDASATNLSMTAPTGTGTMSTIVDTLPTNGSIGCTAGCPHNPSQVGDTLTNAMLASLTFTPTASQYDKLSTLEYHTTNGSVTTNGSFELYTSFPANLVWADPSITCVGNGGGCTQGAGIVANSGSTFYTYPSVPQPVTAGTDIIGVRVENVTQADFAGTITNVSGTNAKLHINQFFSGNIATGQTLQKQTSGGGTITLSALDSGSGNRGSVYSITCASTCPGVATDEYMHTHGTMAAGYVSFGQPFVAGQVLPGDTLVAVCSQTTCGADPQGTKYYVQKDLTATKADGSLNYALLTFKMPGTVADAGHMDFMIAKCASGCPSAPGTAAPTASQITGGTWPGCGSQPVCSYAVTLGFTGGFTESGTTGTSAKLCLADAISNGTVINWMGGGSGALVNEFIATCTVDGGRLKMEYDIRAYADGQVRSDVIFDNRWMFCAVADGRCTVAAYNTTAKSSLTYTPTFTQDGYAPGSVTHVLYTMWDHEINSSGRIFPNIQYDAPYFMASGATAYYDGSHGIIADAYYDPGQFSYSITSLIAIGDAPNTSCPGCGNGGTGPESTLFVKNSGDGGPRPDIGPLPYWAVNWLSTQMALPRLLMMMNTTGQAAYPFHFWDENTNRPPDGWNTYPNFVIISGCSVSTTGDCAANGTPTTNNSLFDNSSENQYAHMCECFFVPYLISGSHFNYMGFLAQAMNAGVNTFGKTAKETTQTQTVGVMQHRVDMASTGGGGGGYGQTRDMAWRNREIAYATTWIPDSDTTIKATFKDVAVQSVYGNYLEYVVNNVTYPRGTMLGGNFESFHGPGPSSIENAYPVTTLENYYRQHIPMVSDRMRQLIGSQTTTWALWLSASQGLSTKSSSSYGFNGVYNLGDNRSSYAANPFGYPPVPNVSAEIDSYAVALWQAGDGRIPRVELKYQINSLGGNGSNGYVAKSGQAAFISANSEPLAMLSYIVNFSNDDATTIGGLASGYWDGTYTQVKNSTGFANTPKLPSGVYLTDDRVTSNTTDSGTGTLTAVADGGAAVFGTGNWTLNGTNGSAGCTALFKTGSGTTTINAPNCNTYAVSNCGATSFIDNTGNNVFYGGATCWVQAQYSDNTEAAQTFQFGTNSSGQDTIYGFRPGTDILRIKSTLDGNSFANAAAFTATCSVSGSDTVCALGGGNTITVKDTTASLTASVTIY